MGIEEYALQCQKLHPKVIEFLQQYFEFDLQKIKVNAKHKRTSYLGTAIWVVFTTIVVKVGHLNRKGSSLDLSTVGGMSIMVHECCHVKQWLEEPRWKWMALYLIGVAKSIWFAGTLYSHRHVHWELEAIAFQKKIRPSIIERQSELEIFKELR